MLHASGIRVPRRALEGHIVHRNVVTSIRFRSAWADRAAELATARIAARSEQLDFVGVDIKRVTLLAIIAHIVAGLETANHQHLLAFGKRALLSQLVQRLSEAPPTGDAEPVRRFLEISAAVRATTRNRHRELDIHAPVR